MRRRLVAAFVVLGWISLSCFDVIEDLDEMSGQVKVATLPDTAHPSTQRGRWGPLANNMVESANSAQKAVPIFLAFTPAAFKFAPAFDLRRHFQLHKFYRVFLI
jgi:hypothetical protein